MRKTMVLYHSVNVHDADSLHIFRDGREAGRHEACPNVSVFCGPAIAPFAG